MLQATTNKYGIETLKRLNVSYDHQHSLAQEDVDMVNSYVELIERTRSEIKPQIGDRLVYVNEHGDYYGNALIDDKYVKDGCLSVCEQPYVPFVWEENGNIRLSVSGGSFHSVNPKELKFLKWTEGAFKDWGHCGACANGAVAFMARVPLWFYAEPNPKYGNFTTETKGMSRKKATVITAMGLLSVMKPSSSNSCKTTKGQYSKETGRTKSCYGASVGNMSSCHCRNGKR